VPAGKSGGWQGLKKSQGREIRDQGRTEIRDKGGPEIRDQKGPRSEIRKALLLISDLL
jgi:hypothetical protein